MDNCLNPMTCNEDFLARDLARLKGLRPMDDDFSCCDPEEMYWDLMRETTKYYKEKEEGVRIMCEAFEETRREGIEIGKEIGEKLGEERATVSMIKRVMDLTQNSAEQVMTMLQFPESEKEKYLPLV